MAAARGYPMDFRGGSQTGRMPGDFRPAAPPQLRPEAPLQAPANDNALARAAAQAALRRVAPRLIPFLGIALTAYELYQWYRAFTVPAGWYLECGRAGGTFGYGATSLCPPDPSSLIVTPLGWIDTPRKFTGSTVWEIVRGNDKPGALPHDHPIPDLTRIENVGLWWYPDSLGTPTTLPELSPYAQPMPLGDPLAQPNPEPAPSPVPQPTPMPDFVPWVPAPWTPGRPANDPVPIAPPKAPPGFREYPYRALPYKWWFDYWLTERGNEAPSSPGGPGDDRDPLSNPDPRRAPRPRPGPRQTVAPSPAVGPVSVVRSRPAVAPAAAPPRRTREAKLFMKRNAAAVLMNGATEGCDFVKALFDAIDAKKRIKDKVLKKIPKKKLYDARQRIRDKDKWPSAQSVKDNREIGELIGKKRWQPVGCPEQWRYVYANWRDINWDKAVKNLLMNEVIDRSLGKANQTANRAYTGASRSRVGLGTGPTF